MPSKTIRIGKEKQEEKPKDSFLSVPENVGQLPLDVLENKEEIRIIAPLAGVNMDDDVEVVIHQDILTIKGQRQPNNETSALRGAEYYTQECFWGKFSRSIILPLHADVSQIEATEENHILYIKIPKKPPVQMRILRIKSKE